MTELRKVISGGQTGVDQAALRAAGNCRLEIGGWCPPGRLCEAGIIPAEFPLEETEQDRSASAPDVPRSQRTEWNVRDSDGTLVLAERPPSHGYGVAGGETGSKPMVDRGTEWAMQCAERYGRPLLVCDVSEPNAQQKIEDWLRQNQIKVLSVGGPAESASPGTGDRAYELLRSVFEDL